MAIIFVREYKKVIDNKLKMWYALKAINKKSKWLYLKNRNSDSKPMFLSPIKFLKKFLTNT